MSINSANGSMFRGAQAENFYDSLVHKRTWSSLFYEDFLGIGTDSGGFTFSVLTSTSISMTSSVTSKNTLKPNPLTMTLSGLVSELSLKPPKSPFTIGNDMIDMFQSKLALSGGIVSGVQSVKQTKTMAKVYKGVQSANGYLGVARGYVNDAERISNTAASAYKSIAGLFPNAKISLSTVWNAYNTLKALWENKFPVTVVNDLDTFYNMGITSINLNIDENQIGKMDISLSLQQLPIITKLQKIKQDAPAAVQKTKSHAKPEKKLEHKSKGGR